MARPRRLVLLVNTGKNKSKKNLFLGKTTKSNQIRVIMISGVGCSQWLSEQTKVFQWIAAKAAISTVRNPIDKAKFTVYI